MGSFHRTREKMDQLGFVRGPARLLAAPLSEAPPEEIGDVVYLGVTETDEVQTLTTTGTPTGGTFTLTFDEVTTAPIVFDATAAAVASALQALSSISSDGVVATGGPLPAAVTITFAGRLAAQNVSAITAASALTGGTTPTVVVAQTTPGLGLYDPQGAWFDLGGTKTGVQVGYNSAQEEFTIDQFTANIGALPTTHEMWMQSALVEVTAERIALAWDSSVTVNTTVSPNEKKVGHGTPSAFTQRRLAVVHRRSSGLLRLHYFRIVQRAPLESTFTYQSTGEQQAIPIRFNSQIDSAVADENFRFGYLLDQVPS